jgi:uncharacterized protein YndB with AHSA1/START domain
MNAIKINMILLMVSAFTLLSNNTLVYAQDNMQSPIIETVIIKRSAKDVFALFTTNHHLEKWLVKKADVTPVVWGKYELYWEATEGEDAEIAKGTKILSIDAGKHLSFEVKGPAEYDLIMNHVHPLTNVSVILSPDGKKLTRVTLVHSGWRNTKEWETARAYFTTTWKTALEKLETYAEQKTKGK